jgi:hypothetical protein
VAKPDAYRTGKPGKLQTCGLYVEASRTIRNSKQNAAFHDSATNRAQNNNTNLHTRVISHITLLITLGILFMGVKFSEAAQWPLDRYHGKTGILLGIEELALQPKRLQNVGN